MLKVKKALTLLLVLVVVFTTLIVPAAAAEDYYLHCPYCNSLDLWLIAELKYPLGEDDNGNELFFYQNWYRCNKCGGDFYVDRDLLRP